VFDEFIFIEKLTKTGFYSRKSMVIVAWRFSL